MRTIFALLILMLSALPVTAAELPHDGMNRALAEQVVVPAYRRMAAAMAELETATRAFCAKPGAETFEAAANAFGTAMDAWQFVQPIAFGPVTENGRAARIQFWPDKHNSAARQLSRVLAARPPDLTAENGLEGKSVALQNLAAFERLLYGGGRRLADGSTADADRYACGLAAAIAAFQRRLSARIVEDWTKPGGFREMIETAAAGNARYRNAKEAATDFMKSLAGIFDRAIQLKLEPPFAESLDDAKPREAESWRSGRSLDNIVANLRMAEAMLTTPGGFESALRDADAEALAIGVQRLVGEAIVAADAIRLPLHRAVADPVERKNVAALIDDLKNIRVLMRDVIPAELGLTVGFNALDGD